jgi:hypothetical protein
MLSVYVFWKNVYLLLQSQKKSDIICHVP